eukprot:scaffold135485_cov20-Tisochrysis_lutea.AAC.1
MLATSPNLEKRKANAGCNTSTGCILPKMGIDAEVPDIEVPNVQQHCGTKTRKKTMSTRKLACIQGSFPD